MARKISVRLLALLRVAIVMLLMIATTSYVNCQTVTADVNAFACPYDGCEVVDVIPQGTIVFINCITNSTDFDGIYQWDYVGLQSNNELIGYVSDLYVDCGGGLCSGPSC